MKKINKTLIIVVLIFIIIAILITMLILKNKKNYIYHCYTLDSKYVKCLKVNYHNGFITGTDEKNTTYIIKQFNKEEVK